MKTFYITKSESEIIASTPPNECWLCDYLYENIDKDDNGLFFSEEILGDDGIIEHLHQLIKREVILK